MEVLAIETVCEFIGMGLPDKNPAIIKHRLYARRRAGGDRRLLSLQRMPASGSIPRNIKDILDPEGPAPKQALVNHGLRHEGIVDKGAKWVNLGHGSASP
jgi:hypothetical protein